MSDAGWGNPRPFDSRSRWHYYDDDGRSLCGKYARIASQPELEEGNDDSPDNCAECKRRKAAAT